MIVFFSGKITFLFTRTLRNFPIIAFPDVRSPCNSTLVSIIQASTSSSMPNNFFFSTFLFLFLFLQSARRQKLKPYVALKALKAQRR